MKKEDNSKELGCVVNHINGLFFNFIIMEEDFYVLVPLLKAEDMGFDNEDDDILEIKDISQNLQMGKYKEISYERLYEFIYEKVKDEIASQFNI